MNPVCVIGIDGATFKFIDPLIKKGKLKTLKNLIEKGKKYPLLTTIPPLTPSAWSSFMTGKNPGKHGVLDFYELDKNLEYRISSMKLRKQKKLWNILSENNLKSIVYFVPFTYPPEKIKGILVSGFLTPSLKSNFTYPQKFKEELLKKFPKYRISEKVKFNRKNPDIFFKDLIELAEIHGEVMEYLVKENEFDFFMGVFMPVDHAQHWLWYDKEKVEKVYEKVDEEIERIVSALPEGTLIIIMSDHGFQKLKGHFYVNSFLLNRGFLKLKTGGKNFVKFLSYKTGFSPLKLSKIVYKFGLEKLIKKDKESFGKTASKIGFSYKDIDFQKTKAFGFGYYGFIFINDKVRFDFGSVELRERDRVVQEIMEALKEMGDEFGIRINVWEREAIYKGPNVEKLPDIVYSLDSFSYVSSWVPFPDFNFFGPSMTEKTGDHDVEGVLIISQKGREVKLKKEKRANITDILPTVLDFIKVDKPDGLDGVSLLD